MFNYPRRRSACKKVPFIRMSGRDARTQCEGCVPHGPTGRDMTLKTLGVTLLWILCLNRCGRAGAPRSGRPRLTFFPPVSFREFAAVP